MDSSKKTRIFFCCILLIGLFARIYRFGIVPYGVNPDEAFAGYEAWSLLKYGIDSAGHHNPVYLTAWGDGMNALESYMMIPFIALFGLNDWVIRLPQLIIACLSLPVIYGVCRRLYNSNIALLSMFIMAICPWHIILSRWALESNLAPGFVLFGLYFYLLGLEKPKFFILSAIMYGLSLYAYATIWISIPFIILIQTLYCIFHKKIQINRYIILFFVILFIFALPLLLFVFVNASFIDEIQLSFISIPKLEGFRSNEVGLSDILLSLRNIIYMIGYGTDGRLWSSPEEFGLLYRFSLPFMIIGGIFLLVSIFNSFKCHTFNTSFFVFTWLICAFCQGLLLNPNATRINILFIPLIVLISLGINIFIKFTDSRLIYAVILSFFVLFIQFENYYFRDYNNKVSYSVFSNDLRAAFSLAVEKSDAIYFDPEIKASYPLYFIQVPTLDYINSVKKEEYFLISNDKKYYREYSSDIPLDNFSYIYTYPCFSLYKDQFEKYSFEVEQFGNYVVTFKN